MGHEYRCKSGRTSFERVDGRQKLTRADAKKIRACAEELPYVQGLHTMLAGVYNVTPDTIGRIIKNELHRE